MQKRDTSSQQQSNRSAANRFSGNARSNAAADRLSSNDVQAVVQGKLEDEKLLQGKFQPIQRRQNDTGLPDTLKSGIENRSGLSMDNVKVHYNSAQPAQLHTLAFAQGTDIHVAPGQEKHLPHEAWHVVQQAQGKVQPTMQMKGGIPVNDDEG